MSNVQNYKCSKCHNDFYGSKENHPQKCPSCGEMYCLDKVNK